MPRSNPRSTKARISSTRGLTLCPRKRGNSSRPFAPDARQRRILTEAADRGEQIAQATTFHKRLPGVRYRDDARWDFITIIEPDQTREGIGQFFERACYYYEATGISDAMVHPTVCSGQAYLAAYTDRTGAGSTAATATACCCHRTRRPNSSGRSVSMTPSPAPCPTPRPSWPRSPLAATPRPTLMGASSCASAPSRPVTAHPPTGSRPSLADRSSSTCACTRPPSPTLTVAGHWGTSRRPSHAATCSKARPWMAQQAVTPTLHSRSRSSVDHRGGGAPAPLRYGGSGVDGFEVAGFPALVEPGFGGAVQAQ